MVNRTKINEYLKTIPSQIYERVIKNKDLT